MSLESTAVRDLLVPWNNGTSSGSCARLFSRRLGRVMELSVYSREEVSPMIQVLAPLSLSRLFSLDPYFARFHDACVAAENNGVMR